MLKRSIRGFGVVAVVAALSGCVELDVVNEQQPDRVRALADANNLQALIGGSFTVIFNAIHSQGHVVNMFPNYATEFTAIPLGGGAEMVVEPRPAYSNTPTLSARGPRGPRVLWADLNLAASNVHDGLRTIDELGFKIMENGVDVTPRAQAYSKFIQGWAWGYAALTFDQMVLIPETEALQSDIFAQTVASIVPRESGLAAALKALDDASAIARQNNVTFPSFATTRLFFATPDAMTTDQFVRLINTFKARLLVLSARTPAERRNVDWNKVLELTANGVTKDFEVALATGFRTSNLYSRAQTSTAGCMDCYRWNNRLIGQADI